MGRSLYAALHRRHGRRLRGAERKQRADFHLERLRSMMPLGILTAPRRTFTASPGTVAVVGGGLAGSLAAFTLGLLGFEVTLFDGGAGGRVSTTGIQVPGAPPSPILVQNRLLETGAELIGINHPLWLLLSDLFGLGMSVVTPDDDFAAQGLEMPLILNGTSLDSTQQAALYAEMNDVFTTWCTGLASVVPNPWSPWTAPDAASLDAQTLAQQMPSNASQLLYDAVNTTFLFNNTQPLAAQSWLANLAQFAAGTFLAGGDVTGFFDDTEVFRCASGNASLLQTLRAPFTGSTFVGGNVGDLDTTSGSGVAVSLSNGAPAGTFDYAVYAGGLSTYPYVTVDGGNPFYWGATQWGYACKYLAPLDGRFWITEGLAPSGMSDQAGMTWEATDNQMMLPGQTGSQYCLTLFTGGPIAQAAVSESANGTPGFPDAYFKPLIEPMYPGFSLADQGGAFCCCVPQGQTPYLMPGYSCPAPGQVTGQPPGTPLTSQMAYAAPYNGRLFLAGEHTSPAWFGFMEGALESGFAAAVRVALAAGVDISAQLGGLEAILVKDFERIVTGA